MQRSALFAALKPTCIATSEAALNCAAGSVPASQLVVRLTDLYALLDLLRHRSSLSALDGKLAEYVFFPLSHVLRQRLTLPAAALTATLQCLRFLLETAWRHDLPPELGLQLLILLTFLSAAKAQDGKPLHNSSDDLQTTAFACLALVLHALTASKPAKDLLISAPNIPALGHAITTVLDGVKDGAAVEVCLQASQVLRLFVQRINDREILSSFLPGILSSLTQVLTPSTKSRRHYRLLVLSLDIVKDLLGQVVADRFSFPERHSSASTPEKDSFLPHLDKSWLSGNAAQTKLALANIIRQRKHDRVEVREALRDLGLLIVRDCTSNLSDSVPMMLDTLVVLAHNDDTTSLESELRVLLASNDTILDAVRSGVYDRFLSLPRIILSNDFVEKERLAGSVKTSLALLADIPSDSSTLTETISITLRDSLASIMGGESGQALVHAAVGEEPLSSELAFSSTRSVSPPNILSLSRVGHDNSAMLSKIAESLALSDIALPIVRTAIDQVGAGDSDTRLPNFWLAVTMLKHRLETMPDANDILTGDLVSEEELDLRDELFAMSSVILNDAVVDPSSDWRMQAVALQGITLQSKASGLEFRSELADVLFPVVHMLGSGSAGLRQHALACIDSLAQSCKYTDARDLIVANNDYLVNGVGARLNVFDLSPEIPQVLLMLIKLSGPAIIPYLDDVIENIFDALEYFHGYPLLVEMLFTVLKGVVEEGVKGPAMIEGDNQHQSSRASADTYHPTTMSGLHDALQRRKAKRTLQGEEIDETLSSMPEALPQTSWKELNTSGNPDKPQETTSVEKEDERPAQLSKTYQLVHRIAVLTQHHLPSDSSPIRASLCTLLATAIPYLAAHEDTLLPLIHTLWPVLVARLSDREAFVVAGVQDVMASMAVSARGFVRGRVRDIWPRLMRIAKDVNSQFASTVESFGPVIRSSQVDDARGPSVSVHEVSNIVSRPTTGPGNQSLSFPQDRGLNTSNASNLTAISTTRHADTTTYTPATTRTVRHAFERLLVSLATHVPMPFALVADIAGSMLWQQLVVDKREDVRAALNAVNSDAVALILQRA